MHSHKQSGFSLLQLSIVLTVGGLMVAAALPGGGNDMTKSRITLDRMAKIEEATQRFMVVNQRRPYPANMTVGFDSSAFGQELTPPTDYSTTSNIFTSAVSGVAFTTALGDASLTAGTTTGINKGWVVSGTGVLNYSWVQAITSGTALEMNRVANGSGTGTTLYFRNPLVAGSVPVRTLGLPDDYAIDGFGRRIIYMVDQRVTIATNCAEMQNRHEQGALALSNSNTFASGTYDHTMWALLSHGKDGQGATSIQGATKDNRIKTGNTDASTLVNAFYDGSQVTSFTNLGLVNKAPTSTFDDIVWVNEGTKNLCGTGKDVISFQDFSVDGGGSNTTSASATFGDVNGDGWQDLIYGVPGNTLVRVVFGKKGHWPTPTNAYVSSGVNGDTGVTINNAPVVSFGETVVAKDVNGDGIDDIIAGGNGEYAVVFGSSNFANMVDATALTGTTGFIIAGLKTGVTSHVAVGDFNGDGFADIALPFDTGTNDWAQGVIYGKASGWSNFLLTTTYLDGTTGVYFNVTTRNGTNGDVSYGALAGTSNNRKMAAGCNVDGDAYQDLLFPGALTGDATTSPQRIYLMLGAASWSHSSGLIIPSADGVMLKFPSDAATPPTPPTYDIKGVFCKDINNDGLDDILIYLKANSGSQEYIYAYFGRSFTPPDTVNIDAAYDIQFNLTASAPSWQDAASIPQLAFGDVNGDGKKDIILSRAGDDPWVDDSGDPFVVNAAAAGTERANAGSSYVLYQPSSWGVTPSLEVGFFSSYTYDGTNGIKIIGAIEDDGSAVQGAVDMNKDGKDDLIVINASGGYFLFGKTSWPTPYDLFCTRNSDNDYCPGQQYTR